MARLRNPAESVVALLVVLGIRIVVEVPGTETLITRGSRAWRPVNVSPKHMTYCNPPQLSQCCIVFVLSVSDQYPQKTHHQHERRRLSVPYAANVAPSQNLANLVVAVAAVLGSKAVEVLVTQNFTTRGTGVSRPVKHDHNPRWLLGMN